MALLKYDPAQTHLTDYYKMAQQLAKSEPTIMNAFQYARAHDGLNIQQVNNAQLQTDPLSLFQQLLLNAEKNASKLPQARKHSSVIKKLSTSLYQFVRRTITLYTNCFTITPYNTKTNSFRIPTHF